VAALLRISFKRQDDLVLRGLALLASGHGSDRTSASDMA